LDLTGPGSVVGNPSTLPDDSHERDHSLRNLKANCIQKGSIVEVCFILEVLQDD